MPSVGEGGGLYSISGFFQQWLKCNMQCQNKEGHGIKTFDFFK